jgi:hypothetical protein
MFGSKGKGFEDIFKHMLDPDAEEYICISDLVGEDVLMVFAQMAEKKSQKEGAVESILQIADRVYVNFPVPNEDPKESGNLPVFSPENFNEELQKRFGKVQEILNYGAVENAEKDFPVLIDMFEVQGITFAFELQDRQDTLESALDYMVETEDYETAAELKSILQEMGSDKIHQN